MSPHGSLESSDKFTPASRRKVLASFKVFHTHHMDISQGEFVKKSFFRTKNTEFHISTVLSFGKLFVFIIKR